MKKRLKVAVLLTMILALSGCNKYIGDTSSITEAEMPLGFTVSPAQAQTIVLNKFGKSKLTRKYYCNQQFYYITPHPHGRDAIVIDGRSGKIIEKDF